MSPFDEVVEVSFPRWVEWLSQSAVWIDYGMSYKVGGGAFCMRGEVNLRW